MPHYFAYFGHAEAAQGLRKDADFLREIIYPPAMQAEIRKPLRYRSPSVA
jgi:shikimate dehydrogenase